MLPHLLIARFLPSGVASVPHDLVDDDGRTVSQTSKSRPPWLLFLRKICSAEMQLAGNSGQALVPGLTLPARLAFLHLWII
jgi:hypothetical protein